MLARLFFSLWNIHRSATAQQCFTDGTSIGGIAMLARLFLSLWNIHRSATALQCCNESHCNVFWILPLRSAVGRQL